MSLYSLALQAHSWYVIGPDGMPPDFVDAAHDALARDTEEEEDEMALTSLWHLQALLARELSPACDAPMRPSDEARELQLQVLRMIAMLELHQLAY